jgi:hypothetical protein
LKTFVEAVQGDNLQGSEAAAAGSESWKMSLSLFKARRSSICSVSPRMKWRPVFLKWWKISRFTKQLLRKTSRLQNLMSLSFHSLTRDPSDIDEDSAALELTPSEASGGVLIRQALVMQTVNPRPQPLVCLVTMYQVLLMTSLVLWANPWMSLMQAMAWTLPLLPLLALAHHLSPRRARRTLASRFIPLKTPISTK